MRKRGSPLQFTRFALAAHLCSGAAFAHISLVAPIPRYPGSVAGENKGCPCGLAKTIGNSRTCSIEADRSDSDRSTDRVTALQSGSTLALQFNELVSHSGRYRVAFDPNGADLADFDANILLDVPDPPGNRGNTGQGTLWELQVPLPDVTCDHCTLQLIQVMNLDMVDPVPDPVGISSYYQCADITLSPDGTTPSAADSAEANANHDGLISRVASEASGDGMAAVVGNPTSSDNEAQGDGGCSIGGFSKTSKGELLSTFLAFVVLAARRRPG
jgi:hypothetical protein